MSYIKKNFVVWILYLPLVFFGSSALGGTGIMLLFGWFGFGVTTKFESEKTTFLKQIFLKHAVN